MKILIPIFARFFNVIFYCKVEFVPHLPSKRKNILNNRYVAICQIYEKKNSSSSELEKSFEICIHTNTYKWYVYHTKCIYNINILLMHTMCALHIY